MCNRKALMGCPQVDLVITEQPFGGVQCRQISNHVPSFVIFSNRGNRKAQCVFSAWPARTVFRFSPVNVQVSVLPEPASEVGTLAYNFSQLLAGPPKAAIYQVG